MSIDDLIEEVRQASAVSNREADRQRTIDKFLSNQRCDLAGYTVGYLNDLPVWARTYIGCLRQQIVNLGGPAEKEER